MTTNGTRYSLAIEVLEAHHVPPSIVFVVLDNEGDSRWPGMTTLGRTFCGIHEAEARQYVQELNAEDVIAEVEDEALYWATHDRHPEGHGEVSETMRAVRRRYERERGEVE